MTVCIAAACNGGDRIVSATDGLISGNEVTADTLVGKMFWLGDWQFMYAGTPANIALISGLIEEMAIDSVEPLSRRRIQNTVWAAYRRFVANFSSFEALSAFDMTLEEFKKTGLGFFGAEFHGVLAAQIRETAKLVQDQILVTGWGKSPISAMIYEVGPSGHWLHSAVCFGVIGSGSNLAQSMLMALGQRRESTLAETIFNVACAKFASEKSVGLDVGQHTAIYVSKKSSDGDRSRGPCGEFLREDEVRQLRRLWEDHVKAKIPDEAWPAIMRIASRLSDGKANMRDVGTRINAEKRLHQARVRSCEELSRVAPQGLAYPTGEPSGTQPSPETPGKSEAT